MSNVTSGLPILIDHDTSKPIGVLVVKDGRFFIEFAREMEITREMFFQIFGGAGVRVTEFEECGGNITIRKGEILEFSLCSLPEGSKP